MKKAFYFAAVLLGLASCTSEDFTGDQGLKEANENATISFGLDVPTATRAESTGATAAAKLNNQFVVYAEKSENAGNAPTEGNLVIQNYQVKWTAGSENSTTSNTEGWEYVGFASAFPTQVTPVSTEVQTIKYWDYGAATYTFTAISALPADLTGDKLTIAKTTSGTDKYAKGYVVTIKDAAADLSNLYFADRVEITASNGTDRHADNAYGGNVTFRFRNAMSQVRVGLYETIPGYAISNVKFYQTNGTTEQTNSSSAKAFGAIVPNIPTSGFTGSLTVTYANAASGIQNQPIVTPALSGGASPQANLVLGTNIQTLSAASSKFLGTTPTAPTWDTNGGTYTSVLPQASNTTNMVLKVDYTLYNTTTKETIEVKGATATVPGQYVAWKPNFMYTYLFKISRDTNGSTGQGVVGLYPITFDAVVVQAKDGQAEYITTVSEPSITTFGVSASKYVHGGNEYAAGSDVYATIMDGGTAVDPDGKYNVYTVATTDATNFPITEASVAESLAETSAKTHKVTCTAYAGTKTLETTVPGEDGKTITLSAGKAIKLAGLTANTYAIEYVKTARTYKSQAVTYDTQAQYNDAFATVNLFTTAACTTAATASSWTDTNKTFYKQVVDNVGTYAYKVIVVQ